MKTTPRFEAAVSKLYKAFHAGELNYGRCTACAVGNILGHGNWHISAPIKIFGGIKNDPELTWIKENGSGYSLEELMKVEEIFVLAFKDSQDPYNKECQFKGSCSVVEYLCELDNIPNPMDYSALFESENNSPIRQLSDVEF